LERPNAFGLVVYGALVAGLAATVAAVGPPPGRLLALAAVFGGAGALARASARRDVRESGYAAIVLLAVVATPLLVPSVRQGVAAALQAALLVALGVWAAADLLQRRHVANPRRDDHASAGD
jgi:hypothetical protein